MPIRKAIKELEYCDETCPHFLRKFILAHDCCRMTADENHFKEITKEDRTEEIQPTITIKTFPEWCPLPDSEYP